MRKPNWKKFGKWLRRKAVPFFIRFFTPIADSLYFEAALAIAEIAKTMIETPGRDKRKAAEKLIKDRLREKGIKASTSSINLAIEEAYNAYKQKALEASVSKHISIAANSMDLGYGMKTDGDIKRKYTEESVPQDMNHLGISVSKSEVNLAIEQAYKTYK